LCKALGGRVECLGRKHRRIHEWHLAVWLQWRSIGLHRATGKLLLQEHVPNSVLGRDIIVELAIEEPRGRLKVSVEALILGGQVVVFLLVHLLIDDILLGDAKSTARSFLVDLRCSTGRLYPCLQTTVASSRRSNVSTAIASAWIRGILDEDGMRMNIPLLILFMGALRLDGLRGRKGASTVGGHGGQLSSAGTKMWRMHVWRWGQSTVTDLAALNNRQQTADN
jgi:hypothetical protein